MANIKPFKGIRYNLDKIENINTVISQPYDRVRYGLQDQYYDLSDYSVVRIIKGKEFGDDNTENNVYTRAKDFLNTWLKEGILVREKEPALYVYHQTFPLSNGGEVTRKAFITAFELAEFEEGVVLPHERTHAGPKIDRLNLTRATETYFGNIFMLYPDSENKVDALLAKDLNREPDIQAKELHEKDVLHKVWVVTDKDVVDAVVAEMAPKRNLIIADGHHRYETALNYRNEQRQIFPKAPANAGFNYRMVAMVSMSNPGLTVLPTHRLIFGYKQKTNAEVLKRVKEYFTVEEATDRSALEAKMETSIGKVGQIGLATNDGFYFLTLKDQSIMAELAPKRVNTWRELDVSILHKLLLEHIMDISEEKIDKKENIKYLREPDMGYDQVREEKTAFLFILNATRIEQVTACTDVGEKMPQKSTDFYPKIVTGFAMLPVGTEERM